jgi:putative transposase
MRKAFLYRLYPNKVQTEKLSRLLNVARELYNACLQERRDAYKMQGVTLNYYDQANELKELRQMIPEVALLNYGASQDMIRRLDKGFKAFFRRIKAGEKPGYPRFKGRDRFDSITFPVYGDGIKIKDNRGKVHSLEKECLNSLYYQSREKLVGDIGRYEQYARAVRLGKSYKVGIFSEN